MIINGRAYELASFSEPYSDGSRHATVRLRTARKPSSGFSIEALKRWTGNRINNYGRDASLSALQEQIKLWEHYQPPASTNRHDDLDKPM